jgi:hypothetical protein
VKLTFTQSGGFTGLMRGVTIDTRDLPDEECQRLESLVRTSGLLARPGIEASRAVDARQYELVIEDGSTTHTVAFDETTKPPAAAPLIKELQARAKPQRIT